MEKLFLLPILLLCIMFPSFSSDDDPEVSTEIMGNFEVSDIYYESDGNLDEINYQFIGQSVSFDNYAFEFKNDATFTSLGAYTAKLTMIMNGKEYTTEEAVPYSSAS